MRNIKIIRTISLYTVLKNWVLLLSFTVIVTACGGGSSNTTAANNPSIPSSGAITIFEGDWYKPCGVADASEPVIIYDTVSVTFVGNTFDSTIKNYTDANCTVPLQFSPSPTASGLFNLTGIAVATTNGIEASQFDTQITLSNGAIFDVTEYDIYYITGDTAYFGNIDGINDASTPALRPDTLDFTRGFIRQ